jgi:hypothetical protein
MSNEPTVKWLEQNDQDTRLADTGLNARQDLTRRRERQAGAALAGFAMAFKDEFGFELELKPDNAGRLVFGDNKVTIELWDRNPVDVALGDDDVAPANHPLQLYTATVDGDPVVRVRYGSVWGMVPEEVDGGGAPASFTPSDGLLVWAEVTVDADGLPVDSAIASGDEIPADTTTTGHFLIGQVAVSGSAVTLHQAVTHSLNGQTCGSLVYNWWAV